MPVTRFDITLRRPLADGRAFGAVGPYEELKGRLHMSVDPAHAANRMITDLNLASTTVDGHGPSRSRVAFAADVSLLLPIDRAKANGSVLVDVVNRGNAVSVPNFNHATRPNFVPGADPNPPIDTGDGWLMKHGWTVLSCGWQSDLPPGVPGLLRLEAPEAVGPNGARITGRVYVQCQAPVDVDAFMLSDRGHEAYEAADLAQPDAVLIVRDQLDGEVTVIPREQWRFRDRFNIELDGGFTKGRIYQCVYTAVGPKVLGLGMAALRDAASWIKYASAAEGNPAPGAIRRAHAYGRSQTGRLLRTMVHHNVNVDEAGRRAYDGIIANVAGAMLGEFNDRFGQNSKDRPSMMDRMEPTHVEPRGGLKVFYTNTSFEYHRGDASLIHTDAGGMRDQEPGPDVRVYHFTGTEHGTGMWPPSDTTPVAADPRGLVERSRHVRGVVNYGRIMRALLSRLDRWAADGTPPPPSRHPRIADGNRGRSVRARQSVRANSRRALSVPSRPSAAPRLHDAAAEGRTNLRHARERGGRRRQRARRHPGAGAHRAGRHAHRLEPAAPGHRRRRPAPVFRRRDAAVREDARRPREGRRPASRHRRALSLARRLPRPCARGRAGARRIRLPARGGRRHVAHVRRALLGHVGLS